MLQTLSLDTDVAGPGEAVRVTLTGYGKQAQVAVTLAPGGSFERIPLTTLTTNNTGGATAVLTLPAQAPLGPALIEAFRGEAQLVIVTHQQQTMESADVLYGVTLEPGGSSLVVTKALTGVMAGS